MSALQHDLPGARVIDLFAGSGALGLESLSRGAVHVTFVENAPDSLRALQSNIETLGALDETAVTKADALRFVASLPAAAFDIALADPPYDSRAAEQLIARHADVPFAGILCIEHRSRDGLALPAGSRTRRYGDTALTFITAPQ